MGVMGRWVEVTGEWVFLEAKREFMYIHCVLCIGMYESMLMVNGVTRMSLALRARRRMDDCGFLHVLVK
jgi:uncharacterized membrane protein YobD (UPF0266 family)